MFYSKYPHKDNFSWATKYSALNGLLAIGANKFRVETACYDNDVVRLRIRHKELWQDVKPLAELNLPKLVAPKSLKIMRGFQLKLFRQLITSPPEQTFGVCGDTWMLRLNTGPRSYFYGMGEKTFGRLELSGVRTKFWNTDVWGDFSYCQVLSQTTDPMYASIPYLIVKNGPNYIGILVNTGAPVYMQTPGREWDKAFDVWNALGEEVVIGAEGAAPDIFFILGPSLKALTRKLMSLVGNTPLPPIWSLGYHQCKWGYGGEKDLNWLDENMSTHDIPCDGLWLDIDYMDGYRVFTTSSKQFPNGVTNALNRITKSGRRVVPILDPGVKKETGYEVFDDGMKEKVFCLNPEEKEFVGTVWPGDTVFPDFTLPKPRAWWANRVEAFAKLGFGGSWIDMNDPSTGPVDPTAMLFGNGKLPHKLRRNEYALGMQMATREGFLSARPTERPFILSRSASTGTGRFSAVWTGDNASNYHFLKMSMPTTINLGLSGIPFNGPDVGGFGEVATEQIMTDWMKAGFLFPFFRNHCCFGEENHQEPWVYSKEGLSVIRKYIRLRYKLMPYLYNLFMDAEELGDPPLRPLLYEFQQRGLETVGDQFMVGPYIMQAPIYFNARNRSILLPTNKYWLCGWNGEWTYSGKRRYSPKVHETPLFFRTGAIVPMQREVNRQVKDLLNVDFLLAPSPESPDTSTYVYRADDGISFEYKSGKRSRLEVTMKWDKETLSVHSELLSDGFGAINPQFLIVTLFKEVFLNGKKVDPQAETLELSGGPFTAYRFS
jgi:alpha-glucosidase